jgi:MIP family channel proteins
VQQPDGVAYVAEFIGTFILVFFVTMVLSVAAGLGVTDFAVIALVHVFVLMMLIHSLGGASGAHFNPAVTAALAAVQKITPQGAAGYWVMQLAGAVAGTLVTKVLLTDEGDKASYGATLVSDSFLQGKALHGLLAEALGTFFLMWAIMAMAVNPRGSRDWAGLVIGATLGIGVMIIGPLTGAGFNPARSFGPALVSGEWADFWIYVVGPVIGAIAAASAYKRLVLYPMERELERPVDHLQ